MSYVLYTEGFPESRNVSAEEFSLARSKQFLESHSSLPAAAVVNELLREISRWSGRPSGQAQEDDMTLLVLDYESRS